MPWKRPMPHASGAHTGYAIEKWNYEYYPLQGYGGVSAIAQDSDATVSAEDFVISAGSGAPSFGEVTDSAIVGLHVDDTGDDIGILWPIPYDCDVKSDIQFAVAYSSNSATTTDTHTWKVLYTQVTPNSATEGIEAGATALSTAIAADTNVAGVSAVAQTPWGTLNGGTLTNGRWLCLLVEYDAESGGDCSSDAVHGLYLIIRYIRRAL